MIKHLFPLIMIGLSIAAAIVYALSQNYAKSIYWVAASVLTATTLFM